MMNMHFTGKLTAADLDDVGTVARPKMYWPKLLGANWYGILLFLAVIWATISGLLGRIKPNWTAVAIVWAVIAAITGWTVYRTKQARARELTQLNASLPDHISLTIEGVEWHGPNGATGFLPWRNFKGWREGKQVILVDESAGNRFVMLPVAELPEIDRQSVRQFLQSQIR